MKEAFKSIFKNIIVSTIKTHNMPRLIEVAVTYELTFTLYDKIPKLLVVIKNSAEHIP